MTNWRWISFWIRDFLFNGGKVKKAYNDIEKVYYSNDKMMDNRLSKLLLHASKTTKFYADFSGSCNINDFPVINKRTIIDNFENMLSCNYEKEKLHKMSTSGSTGTPFTVLQDKNKRNRVIAEVLFFGKICGYNFGEKQVYFRIWKKMMPKGKVRKFLQNLETEDISILDESRLKEIEDFLNKKRSLSSILSYASTLDVLAKYLLEKGYNKDSFRNIKSIISGSEILQQSTRENLKKIFVSNIVSRYSNEENGILAQECIENNNEFHLNYANYYFEFLKLHSDEPADEGEIARIVITDLYNYALPMIRYDTGDLAIIGQAECSKNEKVIKKIYGRRVDLITDPNGKTISPHVISVAMWNVKKVKQWKFVQLSKNEYKIVLNIENGFNSEQDIIDNIIKIMGENSKVSVEYTDEIPVLNSGKRRYIENLCKE